MTDRKSMHASIMDGINTPEQVTIAISMFEAMNSAYLAITKRETSSEKTKLNAMRDWLGVLKYFQVDAHFGLKQDQDDRHQQEHRQDANRVMELKQARAEAGLPNDSVAVINLPAQVAAPIPLRAKWLADLGLDRVDVG